MHEFCQDRDLLAVEPRLYLSAAPPQQQLAAAGDGELGGVSLQSASTDFPAAGVAAGMVLTVHYGSVGEPTPLEILSVDGPGQLGVSVLRPDAEAAAIAPPPGSGVGFQVRTYAVQIRDVSAALAERLRAVSEAAGVRAADYADSAQLRRTACLAALAGVYAARAEDADPRDANWAKAEHYARLFRRSRLELRLVVDADGDGVAEATRSLGNVTLRRS